jgi:AmmeMemoRadiSam system protein B
MDFLPEARPSPIAGTWYAGDPQTLAHQIDAFLDAAKLKSDELRGRVIGLVVPHAGHRYSGQTAAYAYKSVLEQPRDVVVILSPMHQYYPEDFITSAFSAYQTSLGKVELAQAELRILDEQLDRRGYKLVQVGADQEHSIEIQLPFLQRTWKKPFSLMPVMLRVRDSRKVEQFAAALYETIHEYDCLIIASSDLSHFFPVRQAQALDGETLRRISRFDTAAVLEGDIDGSAPACGAPGIAAMLEATQRLGAEKVQILNYSTSADSTGDDSSVVGYGSAAVLIPD